MNVPPEARLRHIVSLVVGSTTIRLAAEDVTEIVRRPGLVRVPFAPPTLGGLSKFRGAATPVYSLAKLLGLAGADRTDWVIMLSGTPTLGLAVDRVVSASDRGDISSGTMEVVADDCRRVLVLNELLATPGATIRDRVAASAYGPRPVGPAPVQVALLSLLSFAVDGQNYGIPLGEVLAVAELPGDLPGAPARGISFGSARFRGDEIEFISLRALLGLGMTGAGGADRCVILDLGARKVGLVVGAARTIVHVATSNIGRVPHLLNRESDLARIDAVARLPGGDVVSLLTVRSLFADEARRDDFGVADDHGGAEAPAPSAAVSRFVIFRLGTERYGFPIESTGKIVARPAKIASLPGAPPGIAGVASLDGRAVPVLDQRRRFGAPAPDMAANERIILADAGGVPVGLLVDGIDGIASVESDKIAPAPELPGTLLRLFDRVITPTREGGMVLVVNPDALLSGAERDRLAALADASGGGSP